jgi:DNA-binding transcriptional MerR regulator
MTAARGRDFYTIGEVVERLSAIFSDLSISKVRFLEEEGLIAPERTSGGYRKFHDSDVQRIELVLKLQRDHFLPLAVIRERLADIDRGKTPPELRAEGGSGDPQQLKIDAAAPVPVSQAAGSLGLPLSFVKELSEFGLVKIVGGEQGDELSRADVEVAHYCWDLRRFGVEPRHLRAYETSAERSAQLFAQILMPLMRHRTAESGARLTETLEELTRLASELERALLRRAVARNFDESL